MSIVTRKRTAPKRAAAAASNPPTSAPVVVRPRRLPEAEAPDAGLRSQTSEAPDAGDGRAALLEHEFTHGRSQS